MALRGLLVFRKLSSSKKVEILQVLLVLRVISWKNIFFMEERNSVFVLIFTELIFCYAELFECAFNFKFCWNIFIFLNINTNQTSKEKFECYKKQPLILGAAVERCSWNISLEVNGQACNFTGVFEDYGHIFLNCSKKSIKILNIRNTFS